MATPTAAVCIQPQPHSRQCMALPENRAPAAHTKSYEPGGTPNLEPNDSYYRCTCA